MKIHETHSEYILDVLEDEQDRLIYEMLNSIPVEKKYSFNRLLEVMIEIENIKYSI